MTDQPKKEPPMHMLRPRSLLLASVAFLALPMPLQARARHDPSLEAQVQALKAQVAALTARLDAQDERAARERGRTHD